MDENFLLLLIVFHLGPLNTNVCLFHLDRFFKIYLFIYFRLCWVFIAVCQLSLVAASRGYSSLQRLGFSLMWLLLWSTGSGAWGLGSCCAGVSAVIAHQLSCSVACGIFWTGNEPSSPAWQVDSLPLSHQGSPYSAILKSPVFCLELCERCKRNKGIFFLT